ncbi:MAG: pentapeptide repeat-containing protein [Pirellulales bacterium]
MRLRTSLIIVALLLTATTHAQIYRWDNGQVIPGTEGITLGPDLELIRWASEGFNLRFGNFTGDLTRANLSRSWIENGRFVDANLSNARLNDARLINANFNGATLSGANLSRAELANATFTGALLNDVNLAFVGGFTPSQLYSTASYKSKDLQGIELPYNTQLNNWNFSEQNLSRAQLYASTLTNADFKGATLIGADLNSSKLANAKFGNAIVNSANFGNTTSAGMTASQLYSTASYRDLNLTGIRLWGNDLSGWDFANQKLTDADFFTSTLTNAKLAGAIVTGADFSRSLRREGTGITQSQLYSTASYQLSDLRGIRLSNIDLTGWDFSQQGLSNASFKYSNLTNGDFAEAKLSNADLSRTNLTNTNFRGANLLNVDLDGSTMSGADLTGADLRGARNAVYGSAILKNTILANGTVSGLNLADGEVIVISDDDGVANPPPQLWTSPRDPLHVMVRQSMTMAPGSFLRLQFDGDPWDDPWGSTIEFQKGIQVDLKGTLELQFAEGVPLVGLSGRKMHIFNWNGISPTGRLSVKGQPGTAWDTSKLYTTGEVTLLGISSDLNSDKDVDSEDLLDFLANWTGSDYPTADKTWQQGDSDADGDVDSADMLVFLSQWTGAAAAARVATVPEPTSGLLVGVAITGLLLAHRRRRA